MMEAREFIEEKGLDVLNLVGSDPTIAAESNLA